MATHLKNLDKNEGHFFWIEMIFLDTLYLIVLIMNQLHMLRLTGNVKVILNRLNQKIYILWTPWVAFSRSTSPVRTPTHHERPGDIVPGQIHLGRGDKSLKRVWILFMINIRFPMQIPWHFSLSSNLFLEHDKTKIS